MNLKLSGLFALCIFFTSHGVANASASKSQISVFGLADISSAVIDTYSVCRKIPEGDAVAAVSACTKTAKHASLEHRPVQRAVILMYRSTANLMAGRVVDALRDADLAAAAVPENGDFQNQRCWARAYANVQLEEALRACLRAIEIAGASSANLDSLALVHFRKSNWLAAISEYDFASKYGSEDARYGRILAELAWADDDATPEPLRAGILKERIPRLRKDFDPSALEKAQRSFQAMGLSEEQFSRR